MSVKGIGARVADALAALPRTARLVQPNLFGSGDCLIEPRLAAIRSIFVNDAALGGFIDS